MFNQTAAVSEHCEHLVSSLTLISQAQKQARQNNTNTRTSFEVTDYIPCVIDGGGEWRRIDECEEMMRNLLLKSVFCGARDSAAKFYSLWTTDQLFTQTNVLQVWSSSCQMHSSPTTLIK